MNILYMLIGVGLIILGRKYNWLFTAGIVYFIFVEAASTGRMDLPYALIIFIGLILGAAGALITSILRPAALAMAVIFSAGYLFSLPADAYKWFPGQAWLAYAAGGAVGLVLLAGVSNWTLIVLSSLIGALMIVRGVALDPQWNIVAFLAAALAGVLIQMLVLFIETPEVVPVEEEKKEEEAETGILGNLQKN